MGPARPRSRPKGGEREPSADALARAVGRGELIGLQIEVASHPDPTLVGVAGRVVDETQRTIVVGSGDRTRVVPKPGARFRLTTPQGEVVLEGDRILARPEDRTKRVR